MLVGKNQEQRADFEIGKFYQKAWEMWSYFPLSKRPTQVTVRVTESHIVLTCGVVELKAPIYLHSEAEV